MNPQEIRAQIEGLRLKVSELILKNPDKAAIILAAWIQKTKIKG